MDTSSAVFQHRIVSHVILHFKKEFAKFVINVCIVCSLVLAGCVHQGDELQLVRDALRSLRDSFSGHEPAAPHTGHAGAGCNQSSGPPPHHREQEKAGEKGKAKLYLYPILHYNKYALKLP